MNVLASNDPWTLFWSLGYRRIVPIAPPGVPLAPDSEINPTTLGKVPGVRTEDGWTGLKGWQTRETTREDTERWRDMGCGVGVVCGDGLLAIDADTLREDPAAIVAELVERHVGPAPTRIGQPPKALFLVKCPPAWRRPKILFDGGQIDFRTYGQFVAWGTHPKTLKPYLWTRSIQPLSELPEATTEQIEALRAALLAALPNARSGRELGEAGPPPDQTSLQGDLKWVASAVAALPNDYPDRADYLTVLYAIKAATAPHSELGWPLALEWALRWVGGENDEETVKRDYDSLKGPYRIGATWLQETAEARSREPGHKGPTFSRAAMWNDPDAESLFGEERPAKPPPSSLIHATPFDCAAASRVKPRETLYGGHYIRQFLSSTIAPSKVGKSSLIIAEALAMASGKPLLGVEPAGPLRVWMWNGEDPMEELQRRIVACMRLYGLTAEDVGGRLFVDSGRRMPIILATQTKSGATINEPVEQAVIATILENKIDVFQVDPFISSHRVSENDNNAIDVVAKRWGYCADVTRCAIEIPHHSRKLNGAEVSVEDGRGASALLAAVRSSRALARMTEAEADKLGLRSMARRLFRFTEVSSNLSIPAPESQQWMELASVNLGNGGGVNDEDALIKGDSVGVVRLFNARVAQHEAVEAATGGADGDDERRALAAIEAGDWRGTPTAQNWVGIPIARAFGLDRDDKAGRGQVNAIIADWLRSGKLVEVSERTAARQMKTFMRTAAQAAAREQSVTIAADDLFG